MNDFTLKSVTQYIGSALSENFPNAAVYAQRVEQGLKTPCFFIQCTNGFSAPYPSGRYYRKYHFVIQYIPRDRINAREECAEIADKLLACLEIIGNEGDYIKGTNPEQEFSDDILDFSIDYGCFVRKGGDTVAQTSEMGGIEGNFTTKGG